MRSVSWHLWNLAAYVFEFCVCLLLGFIALAMTITGIERVFGHQGWWPW